MVLDALFNPLLALDPSLAVLIFSVIILIIINIFYRVLIKQHEAKAIKDRQKEISKKIQAERKAGNTDKMNALMKESLQENSKLMRLTIKPMLISFIIVIIFLPWLHTVYGDKYADVSNNTGIINLNGINHSFTINENEITVEGGTNYKNACDSQCFVIDNRNYEVQREGSKMKFAPIVATFPFSVPLIGYTAGWLAWYILASIPLVLIIRRAMKIYV